MHPDLEQSSVAVNAQDLLKDVIRVSTKTLLEEPRAELTALHTLLLLAKDGMVTQACKLCVLPCSDLAS